MPDGFIGNPAVTYLGKVTDAHRAAVSVASQSPAGAPAGPEIIRLPHDISTANSGSFSLEYMNSGNIVVSQSEYDTAARMISELDDKKGQGIYETAGDIEHMNQTIFVLPSATPRILNISGTIKRSLGNFRAITEDMVMHTRSFAQEITSI